MLAAVGPSATLAARDGCSPCISNNDLATPLLMGNHSSGAVQRHSKHDPAASNGLLRQVVIIILKLMFAESLLTNTPTNPIHIIASNDAAESEVDMLLTAGNDPRGMSELYAQTY